MDGDADVVSDAERLAALDRRLRRRFRTRESELVLAGETRTFLHPASAEELIDEEAFERDERLPYWADLWPSARVLADWIVGGEDRPAPTRVLELGCGMGYVASALALARHEVVATDYYEEATEFTAVNVWKVAGAVVEARMVDWRHFPSDLGRFDLVVASDVLYERQYAELVAGALDRALSSRGRAIIADPGRIAVEAFVEECGRRGLQAGRLRAVPFVEGPVKQTITLWEARR